MHSTEHPTQHPTDPVMPDAARTAAHSEEAIEMPPLDSPADLDAAWAAAEQSPHAETIRHRIVTIAFNNKWEGSLPAAARDWAGTHGLGAADDAVALGRILPIVPDTDGTLRPGQ